LLQQRPGGDPTAAARGAAAAGGGRLARAGHARGLPRPGRARPDAHRADRRAHASHRRPHVTRGEVGLGLQGNKAPEEYGKIARLAERYGFDVLTVFSDLMYQPAIVPLMAAALTTSSIRLGPACLNPFTLHPVEIAGQVAALDLASSGRAYLGLARGAW